MNPFCSCQWKARLQYITDTVSSFKLLRECYSIANKVYGCTTFCAEIKASIYEEKLWMAKRKKYAKWDYSHSGALTISVTLGYTIIIPTS